MDSGVELRLSRAWIVRWPNWKTRLGFLLETARQKLIRAVPE